MKRTLTYVFAGVAVIVFTCAWKAGRDTYVPAPAAVTASDLLNDTFDVLEHHSHTDAGASAFDRALPRMKEIFAEAGVPTHLVWVAEVESSLDPYAVSPAGAVGLFQFMPVTARRFGLLNEFCDGRVSPCRSARAAAKYLGILYEQFGSWRLALAAYNAGEGRVGDILELHGARTFDEISRHLPGETRRFVAKVTAAVARREPGASLDG